MDGRPIGQGFQDHGPVGQPESFGPLPPAPENDTGLEDRNAESGERVSDQVATRLGSQHPLDGTTAVSERSLDGTTGVSQRSLDGTAGVSQRPLDGTVETSLGWHRWCASTCLGRCY